MIGELETSCKLVKLEVSPEICMGEWEHLLLTKRLNGQEAIEEEIRDTLESKLKNIKIGAMELQRQANESLKRKKKRNVDAFADFINKNF